MDEPEAWVPPTRVSESPTPANAGRRMGRLAAVAAIVVIAVGVLAYAATRGGTDADATTTTSSAPPPTTAPTATPSVTAPPVASPVAATESLKVAAVPDRPSEAEDPLSIVPGARMPRKSPSKAASDVTTPSGEKSYAVELRTLEESIADAASAVSALRQLSILKNRVTLASDVAAVQFVEAKATMLTAGAAKGCALMRRIKRENLGAGWREQFTEGLQTCEGN